MRLRCSSPGWRSERRPPARASTISFSRPIPGRAQRDRSASQLGRSIVSLRQALRRHRRNAADPHLDEPHGGRRAWATGMVGSFGFIADIACPSTSLCVATGADGGLDGFYTSTDPAGGAATWSFSETDLGSLISGVSCASVSLCVAVDQTGDIFTSTDPAGGAGAWSFGTIDPDGSDLTGVSCPSARLCVAGGRECEGRVLAVARARLCRRGDRQRMAGRRTRPSGSPPPRSLTLIRTS